ncbi:MAG: hypothetical protein KKC85_03855, partial [Gammaproteobacteria bacterium]|nr:hypothetical protein [Gammaproteobacteria bacterium]
VRGGPEVPLAPGELFAKFEGCIDFGGLRVPARRLFDTLMSIDTLRGVQDIHAAATPQTN